MIFDGLAAERAIGDDIEVITFSRYREDIAAVYFYSEYRHVGYNTRGARRRRITKFAPPRHSARHAFILTIALLSAAAAEAERLLIFRMQSLMSISDITPD